MLSIHILHTLFPKKYIRLAISFHPNDWTNGIHEVKNKDMWDCTLYNHNLYWADVVQASHVRGMIEITTSSLVDTAAKQSHSVSHLTLLTKTSA